MYTEGKSFIPTEDIKTQVSFLPLFCQLDANNRIKQQKRISINFETIPWLTNALFIVEIAIAKNFVINHLENEGTGSLYKKALSTVIQGFLMMQSFALITISYNKKNAVIAQNTNDVTIKLAFTGDKQNISTVIQ
ncbi:hypothetical protein T4A_1574 [Trichinella pseudospiralis]|uniref:Uncharacterized protein n=1 Tax=Trichinella pseudospiralis TaxID=6337 RepID=A0A0V1ERS0_TRIPS|nr:hypothetical protein T4A_1574 [Trichinella pseudospiralis]